MRIVLAMSLAIFMAVGAFVSATPQDAHAATYASQFVRDVNIPDGTTVSAGQNLNKCWSLRNTGTANWSGVQAVRIGGNYGPGSFGVPPASPGATVDICTGITAPASTGRQRATYQLKNPQGSLYGTTFWIEVIVQTAPAPPPPAPGPAPSPCNPNADQIALYEHINYGGNCVVRGLGNYPNPDSMGFANDSASSVKVGSNVKLTLFEHDSYNGRSETFQTDDSDLRNNTIGNDAASSMKVESRSGGGNNGGTSSAYRLPFVGTYAIMTGPGCYWTHTAKSSEAMDFAMSVNTSVIATQSGKVVFASWDNTGFGNLIKIQHADNNVSWYGHLSKFDVSVGATVQRGQTIARSGSSGNSTGPHLHFEIRNQQDQSISIRNLPGVTLYNPSGNPPCKPPGQPDGTATGSAN